jgi:hypothetical protein
MSRTPPKKKKNLYLFYICHIFAGQGDGRNKEVKCHEKHLKLALIDAENFGLSSILYIFFASHGINIIGREGGPLYGLIPSPGNLTHAGKMG